MKNSLCLALLAAVMALTSWGCVLTDYTSNTAAANRLGNANLGENALACTQVGAPGAGPFEASLDPERIGEDDAFRDFKRDVDFDGDTVPELTDVKVRSKAKYLIRDEVAEMFAVATVPGTGAAPGTDCRALTTTGLNNGQPIATLDTMGKKLAKRFVDDLGPHSLNNEISVINNFNPTDDGTYVQASVRGLETDCDGDGRNDILIKNWLQRHDTLTVNGFSCAANLVGGALASNEGHVLGNRVRAASGSRTFDDPSTPENEAFHVDSIAIDTSNSTGNAFNVRYVTAERAANGFATFIASTGGRFQEGRWHNAKVRDASDGGGGGLAGFFAGQPVKVRTEQGFELALSGGILDSGMLEMSVHSLGYQDDVVHLSTPFMFEVSTDMRRKSVDMNQPEALSDIARWMLRLPAEDGWMTIDVPSFIPELGLELPSHTVTFDVNRAQLYLDRLAEQELEGLGREADRSRQVTPEFETTRRLR